MSENESKLAKQLKKNKAEAQVQSPAREPTPDLVALMKDPEKRTAEDEALPSTTDDLPEPLAYSTSGPFSNVPEAPFAPGAKLVFNGSGRLFAGWYNIPILEPRARFEVADVAGPYSIIVARVDGFEYRLALTRADLAEWSTESESAE